MSEIWDERLKEAEAAQRAATAELKAAEQKVLDAEAALAHAEEHAPRGQSQTDLAMEFARQNQERRRAAYGLR